MTLYLIAHVVRGEPAFDIAEQMKCPVCEPIVQGLDNGVMGCDACEFEGYWWIIPTSGHRAYPYWECKLNDVLVMGMGEYESILYGVPPPPEDHPDHYTTIIQTKADHEAATSLLGTLGLLKPKQPLTRRI